MNLTQLQQLRNRFREVEREESEGVPCEEISDWLCDRVTKPRVKWADFLQIQDELNNEREAVMDHQMFENPTHQFELLQRRTMRPLQRKSNRVYQITKLHYFKARQHFLLIAFDDHTISILELSSANIIAEFSINFQVNMPIINQDDRKLKLRTESRIEMPLQMLKQAVISQQDQLTREVNIHPQTLRPASLDPKKQRNRMANYSVQVQEPEPQQAKHVFKETLEIAAIASHHNLMFLALMNRTMKVYAIEYDQRKQIYSTRLVSEVNFATKVKQESAPRDIAVHKHRIKEIDLCLVLTNTFRIYHFQHHRISFKIELLTIIPPPIEVQQMLANEEIVILYANCGDFALYMDHYIKIPESDCKNTNTIYNLNLKRKVNYKHFESIRAVDYSHKHRRIAFGSINGSVSLFDVRTNEFIANIRSKDSAVHGIYFNDQQNQLICIHKNFKVFLYDVERLTELQSFRVFSDGQRNKIKGTQFIQSKGILYIAGNTLESWISRPDEGLVKKSQQLEESLLLLSPSPVKTYDRNPFSMLLKEDDDCTQLNYL